MTERNDDQLEFFRDVEARADSRRQARPARLTGPTNAELRLIKAGVDIRDTPPEQLAYQHTILCQTGLPYRRTDARTWEIKNGRASLLIKAGELHDDNGVWTQQPLPSGPKARLIHIHLASEAIKQNSRHIAVEDSMTAFVRKMLDDKEPTGPQIREFKAQLIAVATAHMRLAIIGGEFDGGTRVQQGPIEIIEFLDVSFAKDYRQRVFWSSEIRLSEKYFDSLRRHAVPLDERAVAALRHSAMGLDVLCWLSQRLCRVPAGKKQLVPWVSLHQQFGHHYRQIRQFRSAFLKTLKAALAVYPAAQRAIEADSRGVVLRHAAPPVRRKQITDS